MSSTKKVIRIIITTAAIAVAALILALIIWLIIANVTAPSDFSIGSEPPPLTAQEALSEPGAGSQADETAARGAGNEEGERAETGASSGREDHASEGTPAETGGGEAGEEYGEGNEADEDNDTEGDSEDADANDADDGSDAGPDEAGANTEPGADSDGSGADEADADANAQEEADADRSGAEEASSTAANPGGDRIRSAVNEIAARYGAVGAQVAVIRGGEIAGAYYYGDAVLGSRPMSSETMIRVASVSKVVLAMLVMRLCELGRLDVDADISVYWGAPVRNPNHPDVPVTIRQILSHTSSIITYDYGFDAGGDLIRSRFLDGSCFGSRTPGAIGSWNYNNYAFAALGVMVEIVMGETVNSLAARYLFEPLGIDAAFGGGSVADSDNIAVIYTSGGGIGRSADSQRGTPGSTYPGERGEEFPGGLTISAPDLAKLIAALARGGEYHGARIISTASVDIMQSSQGTIDGFSQCLPLRRRSNLYGEETLYYHTGSNYGVFNLISYNPDTGNGVVVLTTGAGGTTDAYGIYSICAEISEYIYRNS